MSPYNAQQGNPTNESTPLDGLMTQAIKQEKVDDGENNANPNSLLNDMKSYIRATNEHPNVPDDAEVFDGLNSYMAHMQVQASKIVIHDIYVSEKIFKHNLD